MEINVSLKIVLIDPLNNEPVLDMRRQTII